MESAAGAPLSKQGKIRVQKMAAQLTDHHISAIYAGPGEAEQQTAKLLAEAIRAKVRTRKNLMELDYGLWQGLTLDQIKHRQPKVYRQWTTSPASVRPPGGELLEEAQQRVCKSVKNIIKKHKSGPHGLVLRPVVLGLFRCRLAGEPTENLWEHVGNAFEWASYEIKAGDL